MSKKRNLQIEQMDQRVLFAADFGMMGYPIASHADNDDQNDSNTAYVDSFFRNDETSIVDSFFSTANESEANVDSFFRGGEISDWSGNCFGGC